MSSEIEKLKRENEELKKEIKKIIDEKDKIIQEIAQEKEKILEEKKHIEKEFEEFKAKHKTIVTELRKALKIKANSHEQSKPLGAPKGHIGYTRHIPERIDQELIILKI